MKSLVRAVFAKVTLNVSWIKARKFWATLTELAVVMQVAALASRGWAVAPRARRERPAAMKLRILTVVGGLLVCGVGEDGKVKVEGLNECVWKVGCTKRVKT